MQSKRSFFNKTAFKKNMTRFAPVWILYTLFLVVYVVASYMECDLPERCYNFTVRFLYWIPQNLVWFNVPYALVVAQLLFGDLYNSRMCNALHALPLRRENWFVTNVVSGLMFSLIPTAVMALVTLPLLGESIFVGAWKLPFLTMLISNLQYIACFGLAAFSAMCVGNRFTMIAGYGLLHSAAQIAAWAVDVLYTPMLYGVETPVHPVNVLTPVYHMTRSFYEYTSHDKLYNQVLLGNRTWNQLTAEFTLREGWGNLWLIAGVGVLFLVGAMLLYRKRNLECAGDAVAFPFLRPVFQVLCSLFVTVCSWYVLRDLLGRNAPEVMKYGLLAIAMVVGWFIGRMLVERSTRVFGKRSWYGLGILAAVMALSLVCTHFDVLNIERRLPDPDKIERVSFGTNYTNDYPMTDRADIEKILRLHALAIDERIDDWGLYVRGKDGTFVEVLDSNDDRYDITQENPDLAQAVNVRIYYTMKNGSTMERRYNVWSEKETGTIARELLSRWEFVSNSKTVLEDGSEVNGAEYAARNILTFNLRGNRVLTEETDLSKAALSFLAAVKADCEAGNMVDDYSYHKGYFRKKTPTEDWDGNEYYEEMEQLYVRLGTEKTSWMVYIFPDCENTIRWLQTHGLLDDWDVIRDKNLEWNNLWEGAMKDMVAQGEEGDIPVQ